MFLQLKDTKYSTVIVLDLINVFNKVIKNNLLAILYVNAKKEALETAPYQS